jgi:hypothetical protein
VGEVQTLLLVLIGAIAVIDVVYPFVPVVIYLLYIQLAAN